MLPLLCYGCWLLALFDHSQSIVLEDLDHVIFRGLLRDAAEEGHVLAQADVRAFRRLDGAEPAEMGGMQLPCLEILLGCAQWRDHALEVGEQLVADDDLDAGELAALDDALEIVEQVGDEHLQVEPQEVSQKVAGHLQALVLVVVLVVAVLLSRGDAQVAPQHLAEVVRLVGAVLRRDAEVREKVLVEDLGHALDAYLLRLGDADALRDVVEGVLFGLDADIFQKIDDDLVVLLAFGDVARHLLVLEQPQRLDDDEGRNPLDAGEGEVEDAVLHALERVGDLERAEFGEELADVLARPGGVLLDEEPVGREVFYGDEHLLGAVDDEIAAGLVGILPLVDQLLPVELVEVAPLALQHDGEVADLGVERFPLHAVDVGGDGDERGGGGRQFSQPRFHREDVALGAVRFRDLRLLDPDLVELDLELVDVVRDDGGHDLLVLLHDLLQLAVDEIVEELHVGGHGRLLLEVFLDEDLAVPIH